MKERRRSLRYPLCLEVWLKREQWERHLVDDVSRRGLFVRTALPQPVGQLIQVRIQLPGDATPLEMLARISRQVPASDALLRGKQPGIGVEFFCLGSEVLKRWDTFLLQVRAILDKQPDLGPFAMRRLLQGRDGGRALVGAELGARGVSSPPGGPAGGAPVAGVSESGPAGVGPAGVGPAGVGPAGAGPALEKRTALIFRVPSKDGLERFLAAELKQGRVVLRIPYRMPSGSAVSLRVVHPDSKEEFAFPGRVQSLPGDNGLAVRLERVSDRVTGAFRVFIDSGEVPAGMEDVA